MPERNGTSWRLDSLHCGSSNLLYQHSQQLGRFQTSSTVFADAQTFICKDCLWEALLLSAFFPVLLFVNYLRQVNEVNDGDNVFVRTVRCVSVCLSVFLSVCAQRTGQ